MKDQKGTSLVSVIVSFMVLMIVLLLLQVSITASGRYAARADEIWKQAAEAERHYINDKYGSGEINLSLKMKPGTGDEERWGNIYIRVTDADAGDTVRIYYIEKNH